MSLLRIKGFYLIEDESKKVLTDGSKTVVFRSDNSLKSYLKERYIRGEGINLLDYRAKGVTCFRFTRHYLVT